MSSILVLLIVFVDFAVLGFTISSLSDFDRLQEPPPEITFVVDLVPWACEGETSPLVDRRVRPAFLALNTITASTFVATLLLAFRDFLTLPRPMVRIEKSAWMEKVGFPIVDCVVE